MSKSLILDIGNYEIMEEIGGGSFSEVLKIKEKSTGKIYAAKISLKELSISFDATIKNLRTELKISYQVNHPSVLKFIGYSLFQDKPVFITEYMEKGSLQDILDLERKAIPPVNWDETRKLIVIYGIASGMSYLHSHHIIHRDLKPANILMDNNFYPKVADFGLSKIVQLNKFGLAKQSTFQTKGTAIYIAPETWNECPYNYPVDVYAFAFILYEIITNEEPYKKCKFFEIPIKVLSGERPILDDIIPKPYKELITKCWKPKPNERPKFDEIVSELKNDTKFITETIDEAEFLKYIDFIDKFFDEKDDGVDFDVNDLIKLTDKDAKDFIQVNKKHDNSNLNESFKYEKERNKSMQLKHSPNSKESRKNKTFDNIDYKSNRKKIIQSKTALKNESEKKNNYHLTNMHDDYDYGDAENIFQIKNSLKNQSKSRKNETFNYTSNENNRIASMQSRHSPNNNEYRKNKSLDDNIDYKYHRRNKDKVIESLNDDEKKTSNHLINEPDEYDNEEEINNIHIGRKHKTINHISRKINQADNNQNKQKTRSLNGNFSEKENAKCYKKTNDFTDEYDEESINEQNIKRHPNTKRRYSKQKESKDFSDDYDDNKTKQNEFSDDYEVITNIKHKRNPQRINRDRSDDHSCAKTNSNLKRRYTINNESKDQNDYTYKTKHSTVNNKTNKKCQNLNYSSDDNVDENDQNN